MAEQGEVAVGLLDQRSKRLLEQLRLVVRPRTTSSGQGEHRSDALASGVEFADHRKYVPGDDVRRIDWKAFARHRQLFLKVYEEEREIRISVLLDVSRSMTRGEPPKQGVAKSLSAAFGSIGMKQFDQVRVIPFSQDLGRERTAARSKAELPHLEREIEAIETEDLTDFAATARAFIDRSPGRGLVVIVTDLMDLSDWGDSFRVLARAGHEICLVHVTCIEDVRPRFPGGELQLRDVETGREVTVRVNPALMEAYRAEVAAHVARCKETCIKVGGRFISAPVELPLHDLLRTVLAPAVSVV